MAVEAALGGKRVSGCGVRLRFLVVAVVFEVVS